MVNTVLTDKTGTLTRNVMEFFKASIGGVAYGDGVTEVEAANAARRGMPLPAAAAACSGGGGGGGRGGSSGGGMGGSAGGGGGGGGGGKGGGWCGSGGGGGGEKERNPAREAYFNFWDARLMGGAWARQPNAHLAREFFRMLALCHTVIPDGARRWTLRATSMLDA